MKTALVTGAARGIGAAVCAALTKSGVKVVGVDLQKTQGGIAYDLSDLKGIPGLVESAGEIDILVNNAGVQTAVGIDKYTDEQRARILRINLEAPVELIRAVSKQMVARKSGRIVNLASIAAYTPHTDLWYGVTKAGVVSFTRSFASYLGPHGIQVNAVAHFGNDPQWRICRPPLIELSSSEENTLVSELRASGFTMPGLA